MRISDWSSDVCSSDRYALACEEHRYVRADGAVDRDGPRPGRGRDHRAGQRRGEDPLPDQQHDLQDSALSGADVEIHDAPPRRRGLDGHRGQDREPEAWRHGGGRDHRHRRAAQSGRARGHVAKVNGTGGYPVPFQRCRPRETGGPGAWLRPAAAASCLSWRCGPVPYRTTSSAIEKRAMHRSEAHTSELQSLMRISYAVFCLNTKNTTKKL